MNLTDIYSENIDSIWGGSKQQIEQQVAVFSHVDKEIDQVVKKAGFNDLPHFLRRRRDLIARIQGRRPIKHRRRTPEDEQRILEMTKQEVPNKEIAEQLGLSRTTVSNVKKVLKKRNEL